MEFSKSVREPLLLNSLVIQPDSSHHSFLGQEWRSHTGKGLPFRKSEGN